MKKYLFIVLLIGIWSCEQDSSINKDYVGEWELNFQGAYANNNCSGNLIEDEKIGDGYSWTIDSFYVNRQSPNIYLDSDGKFILKANCLPNNCKPWNSDFGFFAGNGVDKDSNGILGGYRLDGNYSPGNYYNSIGEQERLKCNTDDGFSCTFGKWTSIDNIITLKYDYSGESYNYTVYNDNNGSLFMEIEQIWYPSTVVAAYESECRRIIRKKK
jgi:hypothetical protein